jgi:hypothetical protein
MESKAASERIITLTAILAFVLLLGAYAVSGCLAAKDAHR